MTLDNNKYYPINLNLKSKHILIIGSGGVAQRKLKGLMDKAKQIIVITKIQDEKFKEFIINNKNLIGNKLIILEECFDIEKHKTYILDADLLFICTDNTKLNASIEYYAKDKRIWNLRCDDAGDSDFINPITIKNQDLMISISSSGISPAYSKYIKAEIEELIKNIDMDKLTLIDKARKIIKQKIILPNNKTTLLKKLPDMSKEELKEIIKEESL